jgi:anti-sigma factor RsiW
MKCEELLRMLNDYVDGDIDPAFCKEFKKHLKGCNPCQVVVDNVRKTIVLYREGSVYELPAEFRRTLHRRLKAQWRRKRGRMAPAKAFGGQTTGKGTPATS